MKKINKKIKNKEYADEKITNGKKPDDINLTRKIGGNRMQLIPRYFSAYFLVYIGNKLVMLISANAKHEHAAIKTG